MSTAAKRICVIGRRGQVASALAEEGAAAGFDIVHLSRPELDLTEGRNALHLIKALAPSVVINAAAYTAVDAAETDEAGARAVNVDGPALLAAATAALNVPLIHISTDYVFDGTKKGGYDEDDATRPRSVYGRTKLDGERAVSLANPRHVIIRTAWVYAHEGRNFVRTMLRLAANGHVRVVSDQVGCPTYATDLARALLAIAGNVRDAQPGDARFGVFHLCGSGHTSWAGLAEATFAQAATHHLPAAQVDPITTADYPTPAARPPNSRMNCERARRVHGVIMPQWRDGLARCVARLALAASGHNPVSNI